ncbi:hypothetical protein SY2F82_09620 [Streptomyces sp. Y2F8-2]|uniref:hypothetical protein n=1 Tax=unclassified Streptomyces TaxID=2593676 RepID=UPI001908C854|nr:hypothetical protein [Streptomyces sp. Y2F8-2]GHJ99164.1 hypothetical protein SY2F82_09620 [Streptomyces sp. Y2F8-2]
MDTPYTEPRPIVPRVSGAAVTGAVLAYGACRFFSWVRHYSKQACETTDVLCITWWDLAVVPLTFATALITLIVVYKQLGIRPRLAVLPPTIVLAPLPLSAAQTSAGGWAATVTGGAWACFLALAAWSRYRILGLSVAAALLLGSLVVLYG